MLAIIVMNLFVGAGVAAAEPSMPAPGNLAKELYYASAAASGSGRCDRTLAARLEEKFDRRFGSRIRALTEIHEAKYGRDPDFIVISSCRQGSGFGSAKTMREFEIRLRGLEQKYGGY